MNCVVRLVGGPKDGEVLEVESPAGRYIEFPTFGKVGYGYVRYEYAETPQDSTQQVAIFTSQWNR